MATAIAPGTKPATITVPGEGTFHNMGASFTGRTLEGCPVSHTPVGTPTQEYWLNGDDAVRLYLLPCGRYWID